MVCDCGQCGPDSECDSISRGDLHSAVSAVTSDVDTLTISSPSLELAMIQVCGRPGGRLGAQSEAQPKSTDLPGNTYTSSSSGVFLLRPVNKEHLQVPDYRMSQTIEFDDEESSVSVDADAARLETPSETEGASFWHWFGLDWLWNSEITSKESVCNICREPLEDVEVREEDELNRNCNCDSFFMKIDDLCYVENDLTEMHLDSHKTHSLFDFSGRYEHHSLRHSALMRATEALETRMQAKYMPIKRSDENSFDPFDTKYKATEHLDEKVVKNSGHLAGKPVMTKELSESHFTNTQNSSTRMHTQGLSSHASKRQAVHTSSSSSSSYSPARPTHVNATPKPVPSTKTNTRVRPRPVKVKKMEKQGVSKSALRELPVPHMVLVHVEEVVDLTRRTGYGGKVSIPAVSVVVTCIKEKDKFICLGRQSTKVMPGRTLSARYFPYSYS